MINRYGRPYIVANFLNRLTFIPFFMTFFQPCALSTCTALFSGIRPHQVYFMEICNLFYDKGI